MTATQAIDLFIEGTSVTEILGHSYSKKSGKLQVLKPFKVGGFSAFKGGSYQVREVSPFAGWEIQLPSGRKIEIDRYQWSNLMRTKSVRVL